MLRPTAAKSVIWDREGGMACWKRVIARDFATAAAQRSRGLASTCALLAALACACSLSAAGRPSRGKTTASPACRSLRLPLACRASSRTPAAFAPRWGARASPSSSTISARCSATRPAARQGPDGRLEIVVEPEIEKTIGWRACFSRQRLPDPRRQHLRPTISARVMPVSFIEALPATRLFELWLEQKLSTTSLDPLRPALAPICDFIISDSAAGFHPARGDGHRSRSIRISSLLASRLACYTPAIAHLLAGAQAGASPCCSTRSCAASVADPTADRCCDCPRSPIRTMATRTISISDESTASRIDPAGISIRHVRLLEQRPDDILGIGLAYMGVSSETSAFQPNPWATRSSPISRRCWR